MGRFYRLAKVVVNLLLPLVWRVRIENKERLTQEGAYIVSCNHIYWSDPVVIAYKSKRQIHFLGKRELFEGRFLRTVFGWLGAIPISRGETDIKAAKDVMKTLKKGGAVGIFPEGTRTGGEYYNQMHEGAAFFALRAGCPILPCGIAGSIKFRGRLQLCVGEPMETAMADGRKPEAEDIEQLTTRLGEEIIRLSERAKGML